MGQILDSQLQVVQREPLQQLIRHTRVQRPPHQELVGNFCIHLQFLSGLFDSPRNDKQLPGVPVVLNPSPSIKGMLVDIAQASDEMCRESRVLPPL